MLSILVLVRNTTDSATRCIQSLLQSVAALGLPKDVVEYVLIDDHSDASAGVPRLFAEARAAGTPSEVKTIRFASHQHYAYGIAAGLSVARAGAPVLFISHDMIVTTACVRALLEVAASDASVGVVRPVSPHMDCSRERQVAPPPNLSARNDRDLNAFAAYVARYHGLAVHEPTLFIGDAMLITPAARERVGVFDTRFFGFMADIDYGVRVRRAGLRVVTALGAWLYHEGSGTRKSTAAGEGADAERELARRLDDEVSSAWAVFRAKWDPSLPDDFQQITKERMARLIAAPPASTFDLYQPPLAPDPAVWETT